MTEPRDASSVDAPAEREPAPGDATSNVGAAVKIGLILLGMVVIAYADYATGYELSLFALYSIPIGFATWHFGGRVGLITALVATILWGWADVASGHVYRAQWLFYTGIGNRLVLYCIVVACVRYMVRNLDLHARLRQAFAGDIAICQECRKIRTEAGDWTDFETYLRGNAAATISPAVCTQCARKSYTKAQPAA